jgi:hypothetical protein
MASATSGGRVTRSSANGRKVCVAIPVPVFVVVGLLILCFCRRRISKCFCLFSFILNNKCLPGM